MRWQGEINEVKRKFAKRDEDKKEVEEIVSLRATLFLSLASFGMSMIFFSQNITGNAVANFGASSANWVGGIFFILAVTGFLAYVEKRKK
jgi:hypothetical protein